MRNSKYTVLPIALVAGLAITSQAMAQAVLEEITVTATKRDTTLQEIPMSISAISGDTLERHGVSDFTDIATTVPSVSFRSGGPGRSKLNVRGISAATGVAPTVSFYIDEMPIQTISSGSTTSFAQAIVDPKMYDLERVEVLRGPQGTLYGSSSMGGTIRLITRQPVVGEFESSVGAEISSTTGGGMNYRVNGMVNAPLGDTVALRVVGSYTDNDGYFDRVSSSTGEKFASDVNTEESTSIRASLRWNISDNAYLQPTVFTQTTDMDGKPNFDNPITSDKQFAPYDTAEPFEDEFTMTSLTYSHDFSSMSLLATWSQIDREMSNLEDITDVGDLFNPGIPTPMFPGSLYSDEFVELDDESIEIRLTSSSDSNLQWLVGYYRKDAVSDAGYRMQEGWDAPIDHDGDPATPLQPLFLNGLANTQKLQEYEEDAFFGEVTYNFNDSFSATVGFRSLDYDFHSKEENWGGVFTSDSDRSGANVRDAVISDSETQEKLALTYRFGDDNQVYASTSNGSRPGGINRVIPRSTDMAEPVGFACNDDLNALNITEEIGPYAGDEVTSTELGLKMSFGDSIRFSGAFYDVDWDNIQQLIPLSGTCGNNPTINLGSASSTGWEFEVAAALTDRLTLNANLGIIDAQFDETIEVEGSTDDLVTKGDKLPDVPAYSYNISLDYGIPRDSGEYYIIANLNYVDQTLEIPGRQNDDVSGNGIDSTNVRPDYAVVDLRFGFVSEKGWEAALFADNLFDEVALFGFNDAIAFAFPGSDPTVRNRPRTIGLSLMYPFN